MRRKLVKNLAGEDIAAIGAFVAPDPVEQQVDRLALVNPKQGRLGVPVRNRDPGLGEEHVGGQIGEAHGFSNIAGLVKHRPAQHAILEAAPKTCHWFRFISIHL